MCLLVLKHITFGWFRARLDLLSKLASLSFIRKYKSNHAFLQGSVSSLSSRILRYTHITGKGMKE